MSNGKKKMTKATIRKIRDEMRALAMTPGFSKAINGRDCSDKAFNASVKHFDLWRSLPPHEQ